ncbi:unnamed protein product [Linum tenue]|uniref:Uncharacterized protein n=1 Tax=Linum tenue TaxID=586396 RepID=A0AAV0IBL3_9ROSI|nr:unnamed protein product [Linum tenue]
MCSITRAELRGAVEGLQLLGTWAIAVSAWSLILVA